MTRTAFELGGSLAAALQSELGELSIGPWRREPGGVSFDAAVGEPESVWRVELQRDPRSRAAFAAGERSVAGAHAVLDDVPRRLDDAVAGLAAAPALPPDGDAAGGSRLASALSSAADLARGRARIATVIDGALVARSVTELLGTTALWTAPGLSSADAQLHARAVTVALRTRHAWMRVIALVVSGSRRLAALGSLGSGVGGVLVALPIAWGLVRDALQLVRGQSSTL